MQGEFRGDFTRDTFHPEKHFLRVFTQQGRVQIDADPNEQSSILIHYLQSLAVDLMGPHAAPFEGGGFTILATDAQIEAELGLDAELKTKLKTALKENGFIISKGKYYVNGILCENDDYTPFFDQPALSFPLPESRKNPLESGKKYLIYLDVWERHINYIQDEISFGNDLQNPSIREVALVGVDTATRSQVVWQVKFKPVDNNVKAEDIIKNSNQEFWKALNESIEHPGKGTGKLQARAKKTDVNSTNPCIVNPSSAYRETENQLYRVEIHDEGNGKKKNDNNPNPATFKWSRENSSVVFPIRNLVISSGSSQNITISLAHLGRDHRFTLEENDWVEIVDDDSIVQNNSTSSLLKIDTIDRDEQTIGLSGTIQNGLGQNPAKHPFLRRWDRDKNTAEVARNNHGVQAVEEDKCLPLENGIEICFPSNKDPAPPSVYRKGDYWLIPARTATGDVEWPGTVSEPTPLAPHGIAHHYAPLALISVDTAAEDCRRKLKQQWG